MLSTIHTLATLGSPSLTLSVTFHAVNVNPRKRFKVIELDSKSRDRPGRLIDHSENVARHNRLRYGSRLSVRPRSVGPSVCFCFLSSKTKTNVKVLQGLSSLCHFLTEKVKDQGHWMSKPPNYDAYIVYLVMLKCRPRHTRQNA